MPSSFDNEVASDVFAHLSAEHGEAVTHHPDGGADNGITVLWNPGELSPGYYSDGELGEDFGRLRANPTDLASISDKDTFTIGTKTYAVDKWVRRQPIAEAMVYLATRRTYGADKKVER